MIGKGDPAAGVIRDILSKATKQVLNDTALSPAGVMLLLYPKDREYWVLLNKRTDGVEHHKGEISLPGGARDPEDETLLDTALRETQEEMGIQQGDIDVLGELSEVATNTGFAISTYVGTIPYPYEFRVNEAEIAEVIEVPLRSLMDPANLREEVRVVGGKLVEGYSFAYDRRLVYGATAKILAHFLDLLKEVPDKETLWKVT